MATRLTEPDAGPVRPRTPTLRMLALVTDAHGGFGGISQFNRDAIEAIAGFDTVERIDVLPRIADTAVGSLPENVHYHLGGVGGARRWIVNTVSQAIRLAPIDLVICGHVHLASAAVFVAKALRAPVALVVHGVEAWPETRRQMRLFPSNGIGALLSVSELTRDHILSWAPIPRERTFIVPNTVHPERLAGVGKNEALVRRYGLAGKTVLMTMGRMDTKERMKGFDAVIDTLPRIITQVPNVVYLAVGDGTDRPRLAAKAAAEGLADRVVFAGRIDDADKGDVYRLADAYVMPSEGEGFGIVVLESLASGVPVVVSSKDGTREAVRGGELGIIVDPSDPDAICRGVLEALKQPRGVPPGLEYFYFPNFAQRLRTALGRICAV